MFSATATTPADKFQPSWIRSTFHGPGAAPDEDANVEPSVAILARNRYGREEVLQLQPKPIRAPFGLSNCPIFVPEARGPTVMMQMSEIEQRLQMNINSSKAMSSLNQTDRTMVAGGGPPNGPNSPQVQKTTKNEWTPVKAASTWSRGAAATAGGGGSTPTMNGGRGGLTRSLGRGTALGQSEETGASPYGQKYVPRGRGGTTVTRGTAGSTQFNSRAQGLYDPRDPKDRPRNRLRSTSDDTDPSAGQDENGGWAASRLGRQNSSAWNKEETWNQSSDREGSFPASQKQENGGGPMPEWFEDAEDGEKPLEPNAGTFDDDGRYRKEHQQATTAAAPRWRPGQQDHQHHSTDEPNFLQQRYAPQETLPPQPSRQIDYFYLDPTDVERGPFQKEQMYTWYTMSYFTDTLKVRTSEHKEWKTLGELKVLNGTAKPFDYKSPAPPALQSSFSYPGNAAFGANLFGGASPWGEMFTPGQMFTGAPPTAAGPVASSAFDDKSMLAEKQRFEMQKMQEMQELMRVAQEQKRMAELKELEYRRQQEELRKKFDEEMLRKQMEQLELQKKLEDLEAEKNARLENERRRQEEEQEERLKKEAELKRLEEEKRQVMEEAKKREQEQRKKEEEIERKRHADRAAEEHNQMMRKAEEEALRIRQAQAAARREEEERKAAKDAERMFNNEDVWNNSKPSTPAESMDSPWQTAPTKKSPPQKPKAAAWSSSASSEPREKTLREIQEEEERQQQAEARELARQRKEQQTSSSSVQSALWSNANQRINWVGNASPIVSKTPGKPAWGGAGVDPKPAATSSINWDGPSLQAANKVAPASAPAPKKAATAAPTKQAANVKTAPKTQTVDVFTQWVTKRLKEINKNVDADVLSSFLESVENPNEVEDYVQEYLGESKLAKEFVKEYLQKRCESRKRRDTGKDDLSCARYAGTGTGGAQGKKKKGKGARLVVDGSCLGFRATGDPNRVNQGEIETVPLPAGQKR